MLSRFLWLTLGAGLTAGAARADQTLWPGDAAPKPAFKTFVKGGAVKAFAKGKIYVVEFWATWCGPCVRAMPHITELQKKYKDVVFIGVSNEDAATVRPFVEKMGRKMDYAVAVDDNNAMWQSWFKASGQPGIPATFIVNSEGKVAWIGHPMDMDGPLAAVVAGKYDLVKEAARFKQEAERVKKQAAVEAAAREASEKIVRDAHERHIDASRSGDVDRSLKAFDEGIAAVDKLPAGDAHPLMTAKFELLFELSTKEKDDRAADYLLKLATERPRREFGRRPYVLAESAWIVLNSPTAQGNKRLQAAALAALTTAHKLFDLHVPIADLLAIAQFKHGQRAEAIETIKRAIKQGKVSPFEWDRDRVKGMEERLAGFERGELILPKRWDHDGK